MEKSGTKFSSDARSAWDDSNYVRKRKSPQDARDSTDENAKKIFAEGTKKCGGKRSSDEALREWAMRAVEIKEYYEWRCGSCCQHGKECVKRVFDDGNYGNVLTQRDLLWGTQDAPTRSQQRGYLLFDLQKQQYCASTTSFQYMFYHQAEAGTAPLRQPTNICEEAWIHLMGFKAKTGQFINNKTAIAAGNSREEVKNSTSLINLHVIIQPYIFTN